ncbi:MAG: acyl carrier protein [Desulfobacterales bacterium]|nr:acyl carrier protein [Desulfobacterales bacterium]
MSLLSEITAMIALQLGKRTVTATDFLIEDLGAESVDIVNIIATVEERYGIEIGEETLARIRTVADLVDHVQGLLSL